MLPPTHFLLTTTYRKYVCIVCLYVCVFVYLPAKRYSFANLFLEFRRISNLCALIQRRSLALRIKYQFAHVLLRLKYASRYDNQILLSDYQHSLFILLEFINNTLVLKTYLCNYKWIFIYYTVQHKISNFNFIQKDVCIYTIYIYIYVYKLNTGLKSLSPNTFSFSVDCVLCRQVRIALGEDRYFTDYPIFSKN